MPENLKLVAAKTSSCCKRGEGENNFSSMSSYEIGNLHHCVLTLRLRFGNPTPDECAPLPRAASAPRFHCDRSTTNWSKRASSPSNAGLLSRSDARWKISHMHPVATSAFKQSWFILSVIYKKKATTKKQARCFLLLLFFFFYLKTPLERLTSRYPSSCIFNDVRPGAQGKITVVARG